MVRTLVKFVRGPATNWGLLREVNIRNPVLAVHAVQAMVGMDPCPWSVQEN